MKTPQTKRGIFWIALTFCAITLMIVAGEGATAQTNTFPSSGNAGIGTPTPSVKLEVISSVLPEPQRPDSKIRVQIRKWCSTLMLLRTQTCDSMPMQLPPGTLATTQATVAFAF
jgi:hypothetical protein